MADRSPAGPRPTGRAVALLTTRWYTMDAGTLCLQVNDGGRSYRPAPSLLTPLDFGLVGFSYACGLGAKLACPDRTVVSLMGDGGFGMTGELERQSRTTSRSAWS